MEQTTVNMQGSHARSDFMNELSARLGPATAAKVQSSNLWRDVCMRVWERCRKEERKRLILDLIFSVEVVIKKTQEQSVSQWTNPLRLGAC